MRTGYVEHNSKLGTLGNNDVDAMARVRDSPACTQIRVLLLVNRFGLCEKFSRLFSSSTAPLLVNSPTLRLPVMNYTV